MLVRSGIRTQAWRTRLRPERSDRIEDSETMLWDITLVLLLSWILCYLCVVKGIKSSGKVGLDLDVELYPICI